MKQIYKKLYQDEETGQYFFADENDTRYVVSQESYIMIYILENLQTLLEKKEPIVYDLTKKEEQPNEMPSEKL